ncbi:MAG: type IX secretion system outer membrane channel protein PorV [Bacteroidales bacterium]|nr:type IX secretion system outer membrane channel protein PorV [Bacteroidales bacterium]
MKIRSLLIVALVAIAANSFGQGEGWNNMNQVFGQLSPNVITTAVPFVSIAPDARGGAMGDCGVASEADVYSMHYNPAKYVFLENKMTFGLGYSPWLNNLVNDMNLAYLAFGYKFNERSALGATLRYFSAGEINFRDENNYDLGTYNPNEWAIDVAYSRMLGDYLSAAVAGRFIYSNICQGQADYAQPGVSVAADVSVYYKRPVEWFSDIDADVAWGAAVTNIGSKMSYNAGSERKDFIPTNLRVGGNLKLELDEYNTLAFNVDLNKLMVPTPPIYEPDGTIHGKDNNVGVVSGMIQSFYDAPGGSYNLDGDWVDITVFNEELKEITEGIGIEYWYNNIFAVRGGYFNETAMKGNRKYFTLGAALRYNVFNLDISYLIPCSNKAGTNPLENTLRFNLTFNFGNKK